MFLLQLSWSSGHAKGLLLLCRYALSTLIESIRKKCCISKKVKGTFKLKCKSRASSFLPSFFFSLSCICWFGYLSVWALVSVWENIPYRCQQFYFVLWAAYTIAVPFFLFFNFLIPQNQIISKVRSFSVSQNHRKVEVGRDLLFNPPAQARSLRASCSGTVCDMSRGLLRW